MRTLKIAFLSLAFLAATTVAGERRLGVEAQAYPTGVIGAVGGEVSLGHASRHALTFRGGYNEADRDDNGVHDDESGGGPGFSLGWRMALSHDDRGWFVGARSDVWFLEIDWIDAPGTPGQMSGTTDVIVLQPTAEAGYRLPFGAQGRWAFEPAASLGIEWNVNTDGADVGDGAILLLGASVSRKF